MASFKDSCVLGDILGRKFAKKQRQIPCADPFVFQKINSIQFNSILFAIKVLRFKVLIEKVIAKQKTANH